MESDDQTHPWHELEQLVDAADPAQVEAFFDSLPAGDTARVLSRLTGEDQARLLSALTPEEAADVIQNIPGVQALELLEDLPADTAAHIIEELPSDQQADIIGDLAHTQAEEVLAEMEPEAAVQIRSLIQYADDVAGGLMVKELLSYRQDLDVNRVIDDLRSGADRYRDYNIQYAYVTDDADRLTGVLRMRDLLLAETTQPIASLMIKNPVAIAVDCPLDELHDFFDQHAYLGVPIVDDDQKLLGVVQRSSVEAALADRNADDYLKTQGIVREELRSMPVTVRARRRLAWLSVNIGLNVIAASVIAMYQDTLTQVIALAVFLPIISDMSGCSGNQAVAVSMRELSLGLVRPNEIMRVWLKEVAVGLINGVALGLLIALVAWAWKDNVWLGLVVGSAMALNTILAVSIGGTLPLIMRRMKMDPALASGPVLTTVTDMCGFFLILSLASALLSRLVT